MKLGIDYHGVLNTNPLFFRQFNTLALQNRHQIFIISGSKQQDVQAYLNRHDIPFSYIFSLLDYFEVRDLVTFYDNGSFFVPDELWNKAKAQFCAANNISVHIDDSVLYGTYFKTPFCLYAPKNKDCTLINQNMTINFNQTPEKVLDDIQKSVQINLKQTKNNDLQSIVIPEF